MHFRRTRRRRRFAATRFTLGKPVAQPPDGGGDCRGQRYFRGSRSCRNNDAGNVTGVGPGAKALARLGNFHHAGRLPEFHVPAGVESHACHGTGRYVRRN